MKLKQISNINITKTALFIYILIILIIVFVTGCNSNNKSSYYIRPPRESSFNTESVSDLSNKDRELIKTFIPSVIEWYNSIDITQSYTIDTFIPEDIDTVGKIIYNNESFQNYTSGLPFNQKELDQIDAAAMIYCSISEVMINSELDISLTGNEETSLTIDENEWIDLQEKIKTAIEYYYN